MAYDLSNYLVIGISSRALFDLEEENLLFEREGAEVYVRHQIANEKNILRPGTGFPLVKALLNLNKNPSGKRRVEILILSRNNAATSLRIFNSIEKYGLDITRSAWTGGACLVPYLGAFKVDLFLSANERDVQEAINAGTAAGKIYHNEQQVEPDNKQIRIALDGDAVIWSDESERIYQQDGLEAFLAHEKENANMPLPEGPFAKLLKAISEIQKEYPSGEAPIRTALVTARNSPAHERAIRTLNHWNVQIDEAFFLGGIEKQHILKAFQPSIYFDDMDVHCARAAPFVPTARVPYRQIDLPGTNQIPERVPPHVEHYVPPTEEPPSPVKPDSSEEEERIVEGNEAIEPRQPSGTAV